MTEQRYTATRDINEWLQRGNLSLDQLQRLTPGQQASIGRSWKEYQRDVSYHQQRWQCSDQEILRAEVPSHHAYPRPDGSIKPRVDLDRVNHPNLY